MSRDEYLAAVLKYCYQGEVGGEAVFECAMIAEQDPARRLKWAACMQLETETKARLRPFMVRLGLPLAQDNVDESVKKMSQSYPSKSWAEHMEWLVRVTNSYLVQFRALEASAPSDEKDICHSMVVHETALQRFAELELAGDTQNSLNEINKLLQYPL